MSVTLSARYVPAASIVIARDSPPAVSFAAAELSRYLAIITGGRFPVVDEPQGDAPAIRLGVGAPGGPNLTGRRRGSYGWTARENTITISGSDPGAVLHGVYALLEDLGCVWLHHREGGEIVPRIPEVTIPAGEHIAEPVFAHREFTNLYPITREYPLMIDWMAKNRFNRFMVFANVEGSIETYQELLEPELLARGMSATMGHHSFRYFLPPGEFFADHPEYYALLDGERSPEGQLCTSNPAVVETIAGRVCEFFSAHPHIEMVGLWPNDGYGWCECRQCAQLEPERPSSWPGGRPCRSDTNLRFVNAVAEIVAQEHPDRRLSALAYVNYMDPPERVEPADNVAVCFAPFHRCMKHPLRPDTECERANAQYARMIERWREVTADDLYLFSYLMQIHRMSLPHRIVGMLQPNWQWLAGAGVDGYVMEFVPEEWDAFGVNAHLTGRLSWEPEMDVDAWLVGCYEHLFGPAADEMGEYFAELERLIREEGPCTGHYDYSFTARATDELMLPALEALGRARALAATGEKRHWQAVQRAWVGMEMLMRVGQWQRLVRDGLEARAQQATKDIITWARKHADSGALDLRYIERTLGVQ
ncbi:MAG: DUF4838 domain-containing protein [Armatimonadetes bacterium]|nr:DUF4838 domain-containing protein [Armatimonadota bacterium]